MSTWYYVKGRLKDGDAHRRWSFVAGNGSSLNRLRVHARTWDDKAAAERAASSLSGNNPAYEFKVTKHTPTRPRRRNP